MSDYIKREDAIVSLTELLRTIKDIEGDMGSAVNGAREVIKAIPSADVVEVVRCKECKSYNTEAYQDGYGYCDGHCSVVQDDDFCSYGERRE